MGTATWAWVTNVLPAILLSAGASAASFDCRVARKPMELAICGEPALSALDVRMAQAYRQALQVLSAEGAAALKTSQRSWLRYADRVCVPFARGRPARREVDKACVERELQGRIKQLGEAGLRLGPLVLTRVDQYDAFPSAPDDETGGHNGMIVRHVGYPQIDGVVSEAAAAWNLAQVKKLVVQGDEDYEATDVVSDYTIGCANEQLLSVLHTHHQYEHGAAHGWYAQGAVTVLLKPDVRAMEAGDFFPADSQWQDELPTLFWQAYLRGENPNGVNEMAEGAIRDAASEPERWLVTSDGLQINFSAYEAGTYGGTPGPITVSWAVLEPLRSGMGVPSCHANAAGRSR